MTNQSGNSSAESHNHPTRILRAFLRSEELRRERFIREIEAVRTWRDNPDQSSISRWIADVTLQRWKEELEAVKRSIEKIQAKLGPATTETTAPESDGPSDQVAGD